MTEKFIRHFVSIIGALICLLAYVAGYRSGQLGWWFTGVSVIVIYVALYKFLEV